MPAEIILLMQWVRYTGSWRPESVRAFLKLYNSEEQPFPSYEHIEQNHYGFQKTQIVLQFHMGSIAFHIPIYFIICKMRAQPFSCIPCSLHCTLSCISPPIPRLFLFFAFNIFYSSSEHRNQNMQFFHLIFHIVTI